MRNSGMAVVRLKRRKKLLKKTKGQYGRRKNCKRVAKSAAMKAMLYRNRDRRVQTRRNLTNAIRVINAYLRKLGMKYSQQIGKIIKSGYTRHSFAKIILHMHRDEDKIVPFELLVKQDV